MRASATALAVAVAASLGGSASAKPPWVEDFALISKGISRAYDLGRIDSTQAAEYRRDAAGARSVLPKLRSSRYRNLAAVVHQVAGFWKGYDEPRGTTLFKTLSFNTKWLAVHWDAKSGTDAVDFSDGTWYRAFPGIGFQFHPLENFGKLNNFVTQKNESRATQLAEALMSRAVVRGRGLGWEYYFRFGSGRPPWLSGMAQAVAAQALARAGTFLADPQLTAAAERVYKTIPPLTRRVDAGPWIRLYGFSNMAVLNAQLQTIVSLQDYAAATGDQSATTLATQLQNTAVAMLPKFDTGAWSLYSLGGDEATLDYHKFVVRLLTTLAKRTQDPTFVSYAQRFSDDLTTPPEVNTGPATTAFYPWPADGYRDVASYRVWVSKRSTARILVEDLPAKPVVVSRGWHTIYWAPGRIDAGTYTPDLHTVDVAGNASDTQLPSVDVLRDTQAPTVSASVGRRRLYWRGRDNASPWLTLRVVLRRPGQVRNLVFRAMPFNGSVRLAIGRGWRVGLVASDSSGNSTTVAVS
jgi:hypothetical protein